MYIAGIGKYCFLFDITAFRDLLGKGKMSTGPTSQSSRVTKDSAADSQEEFIVTSEEPVDVFIPPKSFSENDRIQILAEIIQTLAEITELATHSRENYELYEGCIQQVFKAIPNAERATILIDVRGEMRPVKWIPREQSYFSETYAKKTRIEKKAVSWLRRHEKGKISESLVNVAAAMYAPMIRNGNVIGILHVDSISLVEGFTKSELDTLSVIASVLALALKPGADEQKVPSVFISYAHKDSAIANKIKGDLRRHGISVWIDERLKPGDEAWKKQLAVAIQEQPCLAFLMTKKSVSSEYCQWELDTARRWKKIILPVMVEAADVPGPIQRLQYIDLRDNYADGLARLVTAIKESKPE